MPRPRGNALIVNQKQKPRLVVSSPMTAAEDELICHVLLANMETAALEEKRVGRPIYQCCRPIVWVTRERRRFAFIVTDP